MRNNNSLAEFPAPDAAALQHSAALAALIAEEIQTRGPIPFSRYMQRALYEPGYGYYMNSLRKFGADGDFITAPELSPLYSRCVAMQCRQVLQELSNASVLELGAGTGTMAVEILLQLERLNVLPEQYLILELSPVLQARQRQAINELPASLRQRVRWVEDLQSLEFTGVMLLNEVLDALPVERFLIQNNEVMQIAVDWDQARGSFVCVSQPAAGNLTTTLRSVEVSLSQPLAEGYSSEINLKAPELIGDLATCLQQGLVLIMDYGYPRREYFHAQRHMGTLLAHYRHRAHDNVLRWVGLQDITAQIDFTSVAQAADINGLNVIGFTPQASFLLDCGIEELLSEKMHGSAAQQLQWSQQAKTLLLPSEMGERFKVIGLTKQYNRPLLGFSSARDRRHCL